MPCSNCSSCHTAVLKGESSATASSLPRGGRPVPSGSAAAGTRGRVAAASQRVRSAAQVVWAEVNERGHHCVWEWDNVSKYFGMARYKAGAALGKRQSYDGVYRSGQPRKHQYKGTSETP